MAPESLTERAARWLRARPFLVDSVLTGVLLLLTWVPAGAQGTPGLVSTLLVVVPMAWRRRAPVPAAAVVVLGGLVQLLVSDEFLVANVAVLVMVYSLAAYAPGWARRAVLVVGLVAAFLASVRWFSGIYLGDTSLDPTGGSAQTVQSVLVSTAAIAVLVLASWALGSLRRSRLRHLADLEDRARLLELERAQEVRLAATAERARIAREMHDVVAHSLSVVIAQADGGRYAGRADPAAATGALEAISATGRQALADMRSLLGVLREDGEREYAPQPDVGAIESLVQDVRGSGLDVDLIVAGRPRPLPAGPQLAAYRIVQESLTNVLKHAGPARRAWVRLHWRDSALELSVLDDGRGAAAAAADTGGQGLLGMRERAELHGGQLDAGPRSGGGYGVHAVLPYGARR
jgi:signal transduction histidine kinase